MKALFVEAADGLIKMPHRNMRLGCLLSGKNIAIVKTAQGGIAIGAATDQLNSDVSGSLFDKAVSDYNAAVTTLENAGYEVVKAGFVWTQGKQIMQITAMNMQQI